MSASENTPAQQGEMKKFESGKASCEAPKTGGASMADSAHEANELKPFEEELEAASAKFVKAIELVANSHYPDASVSYLEKAAGEYVTMIASFAHCNIYKPMEESQASIYAINKYKKMEELFIAKCTLVMLEILLRYTIAITRLGDKFNEPDMGMPEQGVGRKSVARLILALLKLSGYEISEAGECPRLFRRLEEMNVKLSLSSLKKIFAYLKTALEEDERMKKRRREEELDIENIEF